MIPSSHVLQEWETLHPYPPVFLFDCCCLSPDTPDQVIRVFKADQQSCYIIISKDTTAKDVVSHVANEFGLLAAPETFSLCEVSVSPEGVIKQRRLPDQLSKLADRIQLNGRWASHPAFPLLFNSPLSIASHLGYYEYFILGILSLRASLNY